MIEIGVICILGGIAVSVVRVLRGPRIWDRLNALSLISVKIVMILVLLSINEGHDFLIDAAIVYSITSFLGIILFTRFIVRSKNEIHR